MVGAETVMIMVGAETATMQAKAAMAVVAKMEAVEAEVVARLIVVRVSRLAVLTLARSALGEARRTLPTEELGMARPWPRVTKAPSSAIGRTTREARAGIPTTACMIVTTNLASAPSANDAVSMDIPPNTVAKLMMSLG